MTTKNVDISGVYNGTSKRKEKQKGTPQKQTKP